MKNFIGVTFIGLTMASASFAAGTDASTSMPQKPNAAASKGATAMDQGMTQQDTDLTRTIRERIVADRSLSMRAKNLTIISQNGQVTIKGPVASAQEKSKVEEIAKKVSGTRGVVNQVEVSTNY